jgi:hypothetical protein
VVSIAVLMDPTCRSLTAVPQEFRANFKKHLLEEAESVQDEFRAKHDRFAVVR